MTVDIVYEERNLSVEYVVIGEDFPGTLNCPPEFKEVEVLTIIEKGKDIFKEFNEKDLLDEIVDLIEEAE